MTENRYPILLIIQILILSAASAALYTNSLHVPFTFDDQGYIQEDNAVQIEEFSWENLRKVIFESRPKNRPLSNLSFAVNYYFGGFSVSGYHLVNITLHLLTTVFLFLFFRTTLLLVWNRFSSADQMSIHLVSFCAALVWLAHPLNTEAVTYIVQRMTSLSAMFYILSLWFYSMGRRRWHNDGFDFKVTAYLSGCLFSGLCAFASKENAATLPMVILLYEWLMFQDALQILSKKRIIWFLSALLVFAGIALIFLGHNPLQRILLSYQIREFTMPQRLLTELRIIIYYLSLIFYPSPARLNLAYDYPLSYSLANPATTFLSLIALASMIAAAIHRIRQYRLFAFCVIWFFLTLLIESSIIGIELIFEHRNYLPMMMISFISTILLFRSFQRKWIPIAVCGALVMVFSTWTWQRNYVYGDNVSLWEDCAEKSPLLTRSWNNLGNAFKDRGEFDRALACYETSLEIDPDFAVGHNNLGNLLARQQNFPAALVHLQRAAELKPGKPKPYNNIANVYAQMGNFEQAIRFYQRALKINPGYAAAKVNLEKVQKFIEAQK